jgi:hypothetical protein
MEEADVVAAIEAMDGEATGMADDNYFFFYDPAGDDPKDRWFPFATLMTNDVNDQASDLTREGVYRLNIGVGPETYKGLFPADEPDADDPDYSALDVVMPHPVYAAQRWFCVVNPSESTFAQLRPLLDEAHDIARRRYDRRREAKAKGQEPEPERDAW